MTSATSYRTLRARRSNAPVEGVTVFNFIIYKMDPELVQLVYDLADKRGQYDANAATKLAKVTGVDPIWIRRRTYVDLWMDLGAEVYRI